MIQVKHLTKRYGDFTAVDDISFKLESGHIYGFLGPNGAGKSTTMNIMTGCLAATGGTVLIDNCDIFEDAKKAKKLIGYLPEIPPLYTEQTPVEYLSFVAEAKGVPGKQIPDEVARVIAETRLDEMANRLIRNLSKGYRQRVGIAQALLGNPKVIILDEPTVGLDPKQIVEIRELIKSLGREHTVVLSSHILSEVQAVCDTVLIISKGCLVACDTPENLEKLFAGKARIELDTDAGKAKALELAGTLPGVTKIDAQPHDNGCRLTIELSGDDTGSICRELSLRFAGAGHAILQMTTAKASLEDIFIELTDGEKEAGKA